MFQITNWDDANLKTTVIAPSANGDSATSILVPDNTVDGYTTIELVRNSDGTVNAADVPVGLYYLRLDRAGQPPRLLPFTISTPVFSTVSSRRADLALVTAPTPVTLNLSNMTPWRGISGIIRPDQVLVAGSQSGANMRPLQSNQPPDGTTTYSITFDWWTEPTQQSQPLGLPDAAKGDILYVYQREHEMIGTGAASIPHYFANRFAKLTNVTLENGVAGVINAALEAPSSYFAVPTDIRLSTFALLAGNVHPRATVGDFSISVQAIPHSVLGPNATNLTTALGSVLLSAGAPDFDYGLLQYADFLDSTLWQKWVQVLCAVSVSVTAPGATVPADVGQGYDSAVPLADLPDPIVAVLGPPEAPTIAGIDATDDIATAVGQAPLITWAAPSLGFPTYYSVTVNDIMNEGGATTVAPVFTARVYGTSFRVPPAFLVSGHLYDALITSTDAPWDVIDGNYDSVGFPFTTVDRVTGTFSP